MISAAQPTVQSESVIRFSACAMMLPNIPVSCPESLWNANKARLRMCGLHVRGPEYVRYGQDAAESACGDYLLTM